MRRDDICIHVSPANRARLEAIIKDRNSSSKAVWRAGIVLATADGLGTNAIMKRTGLDDAEVMKSINRINNYSRQGIGRDAILVPTHTFDNTPCALCTDSDGKGGEQPMGFCGFEGMEL